MQIQLIISYKHTETQANTQKSLLFSWSQCTLASVTMSVLPNGCHLNLLNRVTKTC